MADPPAPFANKKVFEGNRFGTRVSRPAACASCDACPGSCVTVGGLSLGRRYQFRVFTRSLHGPPLPPY